jgi:2-polyprenyl-6-methoxyphenol hydroxylase-like FAD-dependent oxidoreductase
MKVAIVGGGYAGRSCLLALKKVGIQATLFGRAESHGLNPEMPLGIWSSGLRALQWVIIDVCTVFV